MVYSILKIGNVPISVTLVKVDIRKNINRYCKLALFTEENISEFHFQIGTGCIGSKLKNKYTVYTDIQIAITEFHKEYKKRTGIDFSFKKDIPEKIKGKYRVFQKKTPTIIVDCDDYRLEDILVSIAKPFSFSKNTPLGPPPDENFKHAYETLDRINSMMKENILQFPRKHAYTDRTIPLSEKIFELIPYPKPFNVSSIGNCLELRNIFDNMRETSDNIIVSQEKIFQSIKASLIFKGTDVVEEINKCISKDGFYAKSVIKINNGVFYKYQTFVFHGVKNIGKVLKDYSTFYGKLTTDINTAITYSENRRYIVICAAKSEEFDGKIVEMSQSKLEDSFDMKDCDAYKPLYIIRIGKKP